MYILKEPWLDAFSERHNLRAWAKTGYSPFNRCVYWDLLEKEGKKRKRVDPAAPSIPLKLTFTDLVPPLAAVLEDALTKGRINRSSAPWVRDGGVTGPDYRAVAVAAAKFKADELAKSAASLKKREAAELALTRKWTEVGRAALPRLRAGGPDLWVGSSTKFRKIDLVSLVYISEPGREDMRAACLWKYEKLKEAVLALDAASITVPAAPVLLLEGPEARGEVGTQLGDESEGHKNDGDGSGGEGGDD
jgi:hypothetical protein